MLAESGGDGQVPGGQEPRSDRPVRRRDAVSATRTRVNRRCGCPQKIGSDAVVPAETMSPVGGSRSPLGSRTGLAWL